MDLYIENCLGVSFPVLPFAFIMQERSTEGIHAFATKLYKRSPHAGPSCLSVELKWDNVERMVQKARTETEHGEVGEGVGWDVSCVFVGPLI